MNNDLVSIIIPCYNGEKYISRCLESIIGQTYKNIEVIVINDGSTDKSDEILKEYTEKFENNKMDFLYLKKENKGVGEAINNGLKKIRGEFLCLIDIDDSLTPDSIEKKVKILKKHHKYDCVTTNAYVYSENDLSKPISLLVSRRDFMQYKKNQFKRTIYGKSIFCPGCHMIRTEKLFNEISDKSIYPSRAGQNWQILLPVYYKSKRKYLNEPLYNYVIRQNSLSRSDGTKEKALKKIEQYEEILIKTINSIKSMSNRDRKKYLLEIQRALKIRKMEVAYRYNDRELFEKNYQELLDLKKFNLQYFYRRIKMNGRKSN